MIEKIGNISIDLTYYPGSDLYSDGEIEDELLRIVEQHSDYRDVVAGHDQWPVLYHLSAGRRHIIEAMDIRPSDSLLEIGAGCGALTGGFSKKAGRVTCVELSKKRSVINATRHRAETNIEIIAGDFSKISFSREFDAVTLIGVLEYADSYVEGAPQPHLLFLQKIHSLLKDGGRLYLAIENQYGMKYFSGAPEDHTGKAFDGIVDYAKARGVRTFSKSGLEKRLLESGFHDLFFYYPMPDYKFADIIYSDAFLPRAGELKNLSHSFDRPRDVLFSEEAAFDGVIRSGYFDVFANSFLVEAYK